MDTVELDAKCVIGSAPFDAFVTLCRRPFEPLKFSIHFTNGTVTVKDVVNYPHNDGPIPFDVSYAEQNQAFNLAWQLSEDTRTQQINAVSLAGNLVSPSHINFYTSSFQRLSWAGVSALSPSALFVSAELNKQLYAGLYTMVNPDLITTTTTPATGLTLPEADTATPNVLNPTVKQSTPAATTPGRFFTTRSNTPSNRNSTPASRDVQPVPTPEEAAALALYLGITVGVVVCVVGIAVVVCLIKRQRQQQSEGVEMAHPPAVVIGEYGRAPVQNVPGYDRVGDPVYDRVATGEFQASTIGSTYRRGGQALQQGGGATRLYDVVDPLPEDGAVTSDAGVDNNNADEHYIQANRALT